MKVMEKGKEPINPTEKYNSLGGINGKHEGLTKREYFAGLAMQGLLSNSGFNYTDYSDEKIILKFVKASINYADELLKQLEQ